VSCRQGAESEQTIQGGERQEEISCTDAYNRVGDGIVELVEGAHGGEFTRRGGGGG
jgi:hypothetical protein